MTCHCEGTTKVAVGLKEGKPEEERFQESSSEKRHTGCGRNMLASFNWILSGALSQCSCWRRGEMWSYLDEEITRPVERQLLPLRMCSVSRFCEKLTQYIFMCMVNVYCQQRIKTTSLTLGQFSGRLKT